MSKEAKEKKDSVSEDLARLFGVTTDDMKRLFDLSEEQLMKLDEVEFRGRVRERCHHTMEIPTYESAFYNTPLAADQTATIEKMLRVWDRRGLSHYLPEYRFAVTILGLAKKRIAGERADLSVYEPHWLSPAEQKVFERVIYERRSVRHWDLSRRVDDETIDKVLKAGLWGPHGCNLQSVRYMVIREEDEPGLFEGSDIPGGPVHLVVLQDMRCYQANPLMPEPNKLMDCAAAVQNLVLAAHAYGLGGCWLTFSTVMHDRIIKRFKLADHYNLVTYVDVGWPGQSPCPIFRPSVEDSVIYRSQGKEKK